MHPPPSNAPIPTSNGVVSESPQASQANGEDDASNPNPSLAAVCADFHRRVTAFLDRDSRGEEEELIGRIQEQVRRSMAVIEEALKTYHFRNLSLSYNGGKDCLVLLILYLSTLHAVVTDSNDDFPVFPASLAAIYAQPPDPFPSMTKFVYSSGRRCHLDVRTIPTGLRRPSSPNCNSKIPPPPPISAPRSDHDPENTTEQPAEQPPSHVKSEYTTIRDAFSTYVNQTTPPIKAVFVGTRRTDPHGGHLEAFARTDHGWPDFMRVHPVLEWRLAEIWAFLRADELRERDGRGLEYCEMYDQGYTSLGGVKDTLRNPKLRFMGEDGREQYRPAYDLTEDADERLGR